MVEPTSNLWERLLFRDYLRQHPGEAAGHEALKHQLAQRFSTDREAYTVGKGDYIEAVMHKARQEL